MRKERKDTGESLITWKTVRREITKLSKFASGVPSEKLKAPPNNWIDIGLFGQIQQFSREFLNFYSSCHKYLIHVESQQKLPWNPPKIPQYY